MKKPPLILFFILIVIHGFSQRTIISLTFQAKDSLNQHSLALDSINVKNLAENCDTTLYEAVSVLTLDVTWPVGIGEPSSRSSESFVVMQNVPNPFQGTTMVRIFMKTAGERNLAVYDHRGKKLSEYANSFEKGWHLFGVSTDESKLLFLKVYDNSATKTIKIVNTGSGNAGERISWMGKEGQISNNLKSFPGATGFIFYLGNQLQFTAYVQGYHVNTFFDNPVSSETYTFAMLPVSTPSIPSLSTSPIINITQTTATTGGDVTSDGGAPVTERGVCWSTSANPTTSGSHTTDGSGTGVFVSDLTGLTPNTPYYTRAYAINSIGTAYGNELTFSTLPAVFTCGSSLTINHVTGNVAPVDKTVTYGTVTNIPGELTKCWITSNLGADHQATAVNDDTEASAGWYWQFNRKQGYKQTGSVLTPSWTITSINENSEWITANDPCNIELATTWRIPTYSEWYNVDNTGGWTTWTGPWGSGLKLHAAGYLEYSDGSLGTRGFAGNYWSSTQYTTFNGGAFGFSSAGSNTGSTYKAYGFSVRCVRDF